MMAIDTSLYVSTLSLHAEVVTSYIYHTGGEIVHGKIARMSAEKLERGKTGG